MDSSMSRMALDNLIRRELKVSDPNNPQQVAEALLNRYKDNPRAVSIVREAQGVPFLLAPAATAMPAQAATSSDAELQQAVTDVERDLKELTSNAILKDVTPELEGWTMAIRAAIQEGVNAARFALDPRQRDKTFGIRRTLGDYARMARLVGALSSSVVNINYRKLAQSLDEVASVLLVMMGEALANVGFSGGRYLLQAPYTELQVRRDAAISTLRNLIGSTYETPDHNQWPRGLDAYRRLFAFLEEQGQGDLRVLLVENELARIMDTLIQRSGQGSVEGLRHLGATAQIDLERMRRLVIVGSRLPNGPASPPLFAFLESLQLFVDAFDSSGGSRLLHIARPPLLFYGLYGTSGPNEAERRLIQLIIQRGLLANELDCYAQCGCGVKDNYAQCQIILDKILYDVDRAIDLYAIGKQNVGTPEVRAAAYSYIIAARETCTNDNLGAILGTETQAPGAGTVIDQLLPEISLANDAQSRPTEGHQAANYLKNLGDNVRAAMGRCNNLSIDYSALYGDLNSTDSTTKLGSLWDKAQQNQTTKLSLMIEVFNRIQVAMELLRQNNCDPPTPPPPPSFLSVFAGILDQELCIQKDLEYRWWNLVQTMAPNCIPSETVSGYTQRVIKDAIKELTGKDTDQIEPCVFDITLPPQYESGLFDIAQSITNLPEPGSGSV